MTPQTNTPSRSIRGHPVGIETVWAHCVERMDRNLVTAMRRPGGSSARVLDAPGAGGVTRPNASGILAAVLEQLLAGVDPQTVFLPSGLLSELKNAPPEYLLDTGMDCRPAERGVCGSTGSV